MDLPASVRGFRQPFASQRMPRWSPLAILMLSMHKARLLSIGFRKLQQEFANFFQECHRLPCVWQASYAGQRRTNERTPQPQKPGKLVSWTPENSDFVRGFVQSRKDQPVLLRSRAICRLSRIFSEIL